MPDATRLLARLGDGDASAAEALLPLLHEELRTLARQHLRHEPAGHTLQTTLLVDEAYVRLINQHDVAWQGRAHFYALASTVIRRLLVDHARQRKADKRGGGWQRIALEPDQIDAPVKDVDLIALDEAMQKLGELDERQARVVELRFFGGLGVEEAARVLDVSPRTVEADWQMAKAWLKRELT